MSLTEKVAADLINAMKSKDKVSLEAIRAAKTAFLLAHSEKGHGSVLTEEEELKIIQKLVKQRRESAEIYKTQNRPDLCEKEVAEADILEKYREHSQAISIGSASIVTKRDIRWSKSVRQPCNTPGARD